MSFSPQIEFLADAPQFLEQVAAWCAEAWPSYYNDGSLEAAREYHAGTMTRTGIPCGFVALHGAQILGTISLLEADLDSHPQLYPWVGCLYVSPEFRSRGVAESLLRAALGHAKTLKLPSVYAWTALAEEPLLKRGWSFLETAIFEGESISVFEFRFHTAANES